MTAPTIAPAVDPTGLNGERVTHTQTGEHVLEIWVYSARYSLETIRAGWVEAFPRARHFTAVTEYRVSAGRRFVQVDRYEREPNAPLHIEEPAV